MASPEMTPDTCGSDSFRPPTVEETLKHPAFGGAVWALEPDAQGIVAAAQGRGGGPVRIAWEIHGTGPIKLVLIMGLAGVMASWQRQTLFFGHERRARFSVLLLDNRGIGASDKPQPLRYSTSEMANDALDVLDCVGWTGRRQLHIVGISLGGMIAQELAWAAPQRVASLSFVSTSMALRGAPPISAAPASAAPTDHFAGPPSVSLIYAAGDRLVSLMFRSWRPGRAIEDTARRVFPLAWLAAPDDHGRPGLPLPSPATTPRCAPPPSGGPGAYGLFASNFQRFQAQELAKRRSAPDAVCARGILGQLLAVAGHRKTPAQLRALAHALGPCRLLVVHGTADHVIAPAHGRALAAALEPAHVCFVDAMGHAPVMERPRWFNELLAERLEAWAALPEDDLAVDAPPPTCRIVTPDASRSSSFT